MIWPPGCPEPLSPGPGWTTAHFSSHQAPGGALSAPGRLPCQSPRRQAGAVGLVAVCWGSFQTLQCGGFSCPAGPAPAAQPSRGRAPWWLCLLPLCGPRTGPTLRGQSGLLAGLGDRGLVWAPGLAQGLPCPCSAASPLLFLQQLWFWMPGPWPCCSFVPAARGHWVASACLSVLVLLQSDSPLHAHHGPVPVSSGLQSWEAHIPESRLLASALQLSAPSASRVHVCVSALLSTCDVRHRGSSPGAPRPCSWSQRALSGARGSRWVGRAPGAGAGQTSCA